MSMITTSDGVSLHYTDSAAEGSVPGGSAADGSGAGSSGGSAGGGSGGGAGVSGGAGVGGAGVGGAGSSGGGAGRVPVVLIAGFTASAETWELQRRALVAAGHRVVALDRRGHGDSETPAHGWRLARHGKDLHDVLEGLDLRDAVLVGGSMGASTIWACYDLFGADRLRGIVTVDQTPRMINDADWEHGFYGLTPENIGTYFAGGVPRIDRGLPPEVTAGRAARLVEALGHLPKSADWRSMRPLLQDHANQDWRDVIARISVPSLFLAGRDSQIWPAAHATAAAALNPLATAEIFDDCGHAMNIDQADRVSEAIVAFAGGLA